MPNKKLTTIKYTSREFETIKNDLEEYARRYYSDTFKDFSEASFGALMLDTVAYIGDILSFYLDYQANESFIDTAIDYDTVLRHGKLLGYRLAQNQSSHGIASFYILVPANTTGIGPDKSYTPVLKKNAKLISSEGILFTLNENVDFSHTNTEVVVGKVDADTGVPSHYAIKAQGQIISGELKREIVTVGGFQKFLKIKLNDPHVTEIISVTDSEGHQYYEVDYLSQNTIYKSVVNRNQDKTYAPSILKPFVVPRRFVVEQERRSTFLQFGYGSDSEISTDSVSDPSKVILEVHGKDYVATDKLDPTKLIATDKFGIAPSDTSLIIVYRTNRADQSNASVGAITQVAAADFEFDHRASLDEAKAQAVEDSIEVINEEQILGHTSSPDINELKQRIKSSFATQSRAVTKNDFESMIYSMPPKFGSVKRAAVINDKDSFRRNINLYVVSEDVNGKLIKTTQTVKENVKTWILRHKMMGDSIDMLDAKIINIGVDFVLIGDIGVNKYDVLTRATDRLRKFLDKSFYIGEPLFVTEIYKELNDVEGVADTIDVNLTSKTGSGYSNITFNIFDHLTPEGRALLVPSDYILEVKNPLDDIKGAVK